MSLDDFDLAGILTRVVAALVILIVTWLIARIIKTLLTRGLARVTILQREDASGNTIGESLATIASLVVWLFGLIAILNLFALTEVIAPIQDLLDGVLAALPGVVGAALIFFIGLVLARIVRQLVETSMRAAGADNWLRRTESRSDATGTTGSRVDTTPPPLSQIAGQLVFALILIVVSISALQVLGIEAISEPATQMLTVILNAVPSIIAAALLLGIGYIISRFVAPVLESTLRGLGTDRALADLGVASGTGGSSPSGIIAKVAQVAIMLFFAVAATRVLGFSEVTEILDTILEVAGGILLGGAVIAVGVFVANLVPRFVSGRTGQGIRYAAIALFVAIGLRSMGLADSIVNLAFGAVVIGAAAAAAIAFGLGGRDAASRQLQRLEARAESRAAGESTSPGTIRPSDPT